MPNIVVQRLSSDDHQFEFKVDIEEQGSQTTHKVQLDQEEYERLSDRKISPVEFIECTFKFLLEREPKESILGSFNVSVISRYFPEYSSEIVNYF